MSSINTVRSEHMQQTTYRTNQGTRGKKPTAWQHGREGGWNNTAEKNCHQSGEQPSQEDINSLKKWLEVAKSSNWKLQADLQVANKEGKKIRNYMTLEEQDLDEVVKRYEGLAVSVRLAQAESDKALAELQQRDEQIATLQQRLLQTESRVKVQEKKMEEVCRLKDLLREKKKLGSVNASKHKNTLCNVADTQSALDVTKDQCQTMEERLKCQLAQRDENHLQELSQNEAAQREEISEQEESFRKELADQRNSFEQKLADLEVNVARQLSEEEESHKKVFSEQEERLNKILSDAEEDMKQQQQLLEREKSIQKELSDGQELAELRAKKESEAQRSEEENLELVIQMKEESSKPEETQQTKKKNEELSEASDPVLKKTRAVSGASP